MRFMQIESVLQTKNRYELAKNWFSVAMPITIVLWTCTQEENSLKVSFMSTAIVSENLAIIGQVIACTLKDKGVGNF